jgi:hypothetical protein
MVAGAPVRAAAPEDAALLRDGVFAHDRDDAVAARAHPEYDAIPLRAGAFDLLPSLGVTAEAVDNVYAVETGRRADTVLRLKPAIRAASSWGRHALTAAASLSASAYARSSGEDTVDRSIVLNGRVDANRALALSSGGQLARGTEARTDTASQTQIDGTLAHPIRYDQAEAHAEFVYGVARYRIAGRVMVEALSYDNGRAYSGATLYQHDRDHTTSVEAVRGDYDLTPSVAVFARAALNQRAFRNPAPGETLRNSHGYDLQLGIHLGLTRLIQGEAALGTLGQTYDARLYPQVAGLSFDSRLTWLATQLTTITASARRTVQDAGIPNVSGSLATRLGAQIDHELLRNLLLTASLSHSRFDFRGYDRRDANTCARVGARYLMNRAVTLNLALDHQRQESVGAFRGARFSANRLSATVTYAL